MTSKVRVGGQLYRLTMDDRGLRLDLAAGGVEPYEYPYDVITSANASTNGYYEPCIDLTVSYNFNESASMTMVFDLDDERDNVLRQILSVTGGGAGGYQQAPAAAASSYGQADYGQDMYGQNGGGYGSNGGYGNGGYESGMSSPNARNANAQNARGGYANPQYDGGYGREGGYQDNFGQNSGQNYGQNYRQYPQNQPYNEYSDENTDVYGANRSGGYGGYNDGMGGYGSDGGYGNGGYGQQNTGYGQNGGYGNGSGYHDGCSQNGGDYRNNYSDGYSDGYSGYRDNGNSYSDGYSDRYSDGYSDNDRYGDRDDGYGRGYGSDYGSYDSGRQSFGEYKYSQGSLSLPEKIIGFVRYPSETFESSNNDELPTVLIYGALMLLLFSVVNVVIAAVIGSAAAPDNAVFGGLLSNGGELVRLILEYLIFSIICLLVYGILVFLLTKITGQGLSPQESLTTTIYSSTALGTIGLIPLVGIFIAPLFLIFLQIKGLAAGYVQDIKFAVIAAVLPAIIMFAVFYYVVVSGEVAFI